MNVFLLLLFVLISGSGFGVLSGVFFLGFFLSVSLWVSLWASFWVSLLVGFPSSPCLLQRVWLRPGALAGGIVGSLFLSRFCTECVRSFGFLGSMACDTDRCRFPAGRGFGASSQGYEFL